MLEHNPDLPAIIERGRAITVLNDPQPLSIEEYRQRRMLMKEVVADMEEDVDFGIIPGTKDRSLWEPGAENLRSTFNIQFKNIVVEEREDFKTHDYYYKYRCVQLLGPDIEGPEWTASAWSKERKFWCKGGRREDACPNPCDADHGPKGMEPFMLSHNVRDRAQKRAFVAMIRNVTGATGLFKGTGADRHDSPDDMPYQVETDATGGGNAHPWLVTCPVHQVKWIKTEKMREPAHRFENGEWCNQSRALKPMLDKAILEITADSWEDKDVRTFLKENFDGTWSNLSPKLQLDAIEKLKHTPPPSTKDPKPEPQPAPAPAPAPVMAAGPTDEPPTGVDRDTGVFEDPPPENEGPPQEPEGPPREGQGPMKGMGEEIAPPTDH